MIEKEKHEEIKKQQSLLEKKVKEDKKSLIFLSILSILFPPMLLLPLLFSIVYSNWYRKIKYLKDNQNEKELLDIVKNAKTRNNKYFYALYALTDLGNLEIKQIIIDEIKKIDQFAESRYTAYEKSKFATILAHLDQLEENQIEKPIKKEKLAKNNSELDIIKVHFIEEEPKKAKCMVTKLALDFDKKEIVICPECLNYAEKSSLKNWLRENNYCPVCKTKLTIDDFPLIIIKKK